MLHSVDTPACIKLYAIMPNDMQNHIYFLLAISFLASDPSKNTFGVGVCVQKCSLVAYRPITCVVDLN